MMMTQESHALSSPPGIADQEKIIKELWVRENSINSIDVSQYSSFIRYYGRECRLLQLGVSKDVWASSEMIAKTHTDILWIVDRISHERMAHRPKIRESLRQHFGAASDISINRSIDFALRIWLTMNIREKKFVLHTQGTTVLQWDDHSTLVDFVTRNFPHAKSQTTEQLDHNFTAANINRFSGIEIEWTPCLADHLKLNKSQKILRIYPFKQILLSHLNESHTGPIIPETVLKETLLSLNLLFPHWDTMTDNFLLKRDENFHKFGPFDDPRPIGLASFDHWKDRLVELHQAFHALPVGWTELWADRRNPLQWYTFWLAFMILVLTIVFGIISSVTAIMQTRIAYSSLELGRQQAK